MTALRIFRLAILAFVLCLGFPVRATLAQQQGSTDPTVPARPTVLQMTPGNKLGAQRPGGNDAAGGKRPRIIPVGPGRAGGDDVGGDTPAPAMKTSPNDYTFCNQTSYVLSIAVGMKNGPMVFTRGWWPIPPGDCKVVIKGPLNQSVYYTFAQSSSAHLGPMRTWGGTHDLCIGRLPFQASNMEGSPCGPGYIPRGFASVDTQGKTGWLTMLSEGGQLKSLSAAKIAGLQRLLTDIGLFDGAIDGVSGPKFTEAMNQARTALGAPGSDVSALYTKLVAEANRQQAASGLTFCNRTQSAIWTAYGRELQGKLMSRGWYRLMPEQCEKIVQERLTEPYIYGFAAVEKTEGVPETWGGTKIFCTKEASFDFEDSTNCSGKGFASTGFFQINTNGRPSVTFEFVPRAEPAPETTGQ